MKIKRFEAASMTDALKSIKQDFGEDAVILSAKSIKKSNGLLGAKRSSKVVVTAAIDTPVVPVKKVTKKQKDQTSITSPVTTANNDSVDAGKLSFLKRFNPITRTGQLKLQSKFVNMDSELDKEKPADAVYQKLVSQGMEEDIAKEFNQQVVSLSASELVDTDEMHSAFSHIIQAQQIVVSPPHADRSSMRVVVLVGPTGTGKTTMAAKLAAMQVRQTPASAAFVSLDDRRVAGCAELDRYANILGIQLQTANDADEIGPLFDKLGSHQLVVVDTPGLSPNDTELREHIRRMIAAMPKAEVHMLLNAESQNRAMAKAITFFKEVGIQYLGFTRLDWTDTVGGLINQAMNFDTPIALLSDTAKVNQGTQWATAEKLAGLLLSSMPQKHAASDQGNSLMTSEGTKTESASINYVANRNSDIFHKYDCQSVKRINSDNMVEFSDPAEAMGQKFKPCRMCCGELLVSKPIQRVAYKYASSR